MKWLDNAIKKAGGYKEVAARIVISEHHLRNVGTGRRPLGRSLLQKLQAEFPKIPNKRWVEALQHVPATRPNPSGAEVAANAS